jgi:hypothetical protein
VNRSGSLDHDLTAEIKREGAHLDRVRVPMWFTGSAARQLTPAMLWWVLDDGEVTTSFWTARRTRWWRRFRRLCPEEGEEFGWRSSGGSVLRAIVDCAILLQISRGNQVREER